jgi:VCBS repeat-containing protein
MSNLTSGAPIQPVGRGGQKNVYPVKATAQLYESAMVAEIGGALCTGTTAGAGDCVGVVTHDALGGASDGAVRAEVLTDVIVKMTAGSNAPTDATAKFSPLYMETDNTVGTGAVGQRLAGLFMGLEDDGLVRVYIGPAKPGASIVNGTALADTASQNAEIIGAKTRYTFPTMSQNSAVTLVTTNAVAGDEITISRTDASAHTLTITNGGSGAGNLAVLVASKVGFCKAYFDGTNWNLDSCSGT